MQKSVFRILTESGKANISCDDDKKSVDLAELLGIDICDFKDSISVEDGMVYAYNTSGVQFIIILFQHFLWYFSFEATASCAPKNLILKTSNDDGHSLNAVFSSRSLESCIISCKHSADKR